VASDLAVPAMVAIVGGSAVVGQVLKLLLQDADYDTKFIPEQSLDEPGSLDEIQLLLFPPGLSAESRRAVAKLIADRSLEARIPILELTWNAQAEYAEVGNFVRWPCRVEELKRQIKAFLLDSSGMSQDGQVQQGPQEEKETIHDQSAG
jgi:hypothetical protein